MTNLIISVFIASFCLPLAIYYFIQVHRYLDEQQREQAKAREFGGRL